MWKSVPYLHLPSKYRYSTDLHIFTLLVNFKLECSDYWITIIVVTSNHTENILILLDYCNKFVFCYLCLLLVDKMSLSILHIVTLDYNVNKHKVWTSTTAISDTDKHCHCYSNKALLCNTILRSSCLPQLLAIYESVFHFWKFYLLKYEYRGKHWNWRFSKIKNKNWVHCKKCRFSFICL